MNRNITENVLGEKTWPRGSNKGGRRSDDDGVDVITLSLTSVSYLLLACDPFMLAEGGSSNIVIADFCV